MSRVSNRPGCSGPWSPARARMSDARSAVIQSRPAGRRSASIRAAVVLPRSPTSAARLSWQALAQFLDLGGQRRGVSGIALEPLDRDRTPIGGAQQAEDDLRLVALSVAAVAVLGEFAGAAFGEGGGEGGGHEV